MTPAEIAAACENAGEGMQGALLEIAWEAIAPTWHIEKSRDLAGEFTHKLEAHAYLDAALMLLPEGMGWFIGWGQSRPDELMAGARLLRHAEFAGFEVNNDVIAEGEGRTPALALLAAIMRAVS